MNDLCSKIYISGGGQQTMPLNYNISTLFDPPPLLERVLLLLGRAPCCVGLLLSDSRRAPEAMCAKVAIK